MEYVIDDPPADEDSDTPASTIHNYVQDAKTMIRERLEAYNDDDYMHNQVLNGDRDLVGQHKSSIVGFVKVHSSFDDMESMGAKPGSLHYVDDDDNRGLYYIDKSGNPVQSGVDDHSMLSDLDDPSAHTQYLLKDGSRAAAADITLDSGASSANEVGSGDDRPLEDSHVDDSWIDGHGSNSIVLRHLDLSGSKIDVSFLDKFDNVEEDTAQTDIEQLDLPPRVYIL